MSRSKDYVQTEKSYYRDNHCSKLRQHKNNIPSIFDLRGIKIDLKENSTMQTPSEERTSPVVIDDTINNGLKKSTMLTSSEERSSPAVLNDGVRSGCSSMRTNTNTSAKQEAMKITIWTMVSISLVFVTIYFKLNTKKTLETANVI
ncbi:uncharacterized protein LOC111102945 isoform X2 [Crassostrea virginica]